MFHTTCILSLECRDMTPWPGLPEAIRTGVVAKYQAASSGRVDHD